MQTLILAGGLGKRLRSVLDTTPKPLAPINGKPFLEILVRFLKTNGFREFTFTLCYEHRKIQDWLYEEQKNLFKGCKVNDIVEDSPLGTGGAVLNFLQQNRKINQFLVTNADTYIDVNLDDLKNSPHSAVLASNVMQPDRYDGFSLKNGFVKEIIKRELMLSGKASHECVFAGFAKIITKDLKDTKVRVGSFEDIVLKPLIKERKLVASVTNVPFIDYGTPEDYKKIQRKFVGK